MMDEKYNEISISELNGREDPLVDAEYEAFVSKFRPRKTTDDCYTPTEIYAVVRNWACDKYCIDPASIVRPFYPGGDYENFDYPAGCVVLDNPPFSMLSKILEFYLDRGIQFFLFAPSLTAFSGRKTLMRCNHIICDANIVYENGAFVKTSFVTSFGGDVVAQSAPELGKAINEAVAKLRKQTVKSLPKYEYPDEVITAAKLQYYAAHGTAFVVRRKDCMPIYALDAQRKHKKTIFGGGLLLSEKAAAEKAAAEKAAAEKAAAEKWQLSDAEMQIVAGLGHYD